MGRGRPACLPILGEHTGSLLRKYVKSMSETTDQKIARLRAELKQARQNLLTAEAELAELILVAGQANLNNRVGNASKQLLGP